MCETIAIDPTMDATIGGGGYIPSLRQRGVIGPHEKYYEYCFILNNKKNNKNTN